MNEQKMKAAPLSPYAQFCFEFLGYNFKDRFNGKTLTKGQMWWRDRKEAMALLNEFKQKEYITSSQWALVHTPQFLAQPVNYAVAQGETH